MTFPMSNRAERMKSVLQATFAPSELAVIDDSHSHAGHAGARPEGETHYRVRMVSHRFTGETRLARSRAVHAALTAEFNSGLHALSLELAAPEDTAKT